ncbi:unnamed protein product [Phytophthora lilii]|uniref:Unnamed protein product n=1 Tax=Phytophthora lilii TaxID=2077276 RepID=A0A9W6X8P1_9STRA|nr:unnamed protein product [Phytophthora lilii]
MLRWRKAVRQYAANRYVQKAGSDEFRITSDCKCAQFDGDFQSCEGAKALGKFDMLKGFWQLPPAEDSREQFSFQTDGVFTPTRAPQGGVDSALHFQATMQEVFDDLINEHLLVYVDDVILFASSYEEYLQVLEQSVNWCGKNINGSGVSHDPERVAALTSLPLPTNAAELQHSSVRLTGLGTQLLIMDEP